MVPVGVNYDAAGDQNCVSVVGKGFVDILVTGEVFHEKESVDGVEELLAMREGRYANEAASESNNRDNLGQGAYKL